MAQIDDIRIRVQTILNVNDDAVVNGLITNGIDAVNLYCGTDTLPTELEFVVVETTIARYNRIGNEGIDNEIIEAITHSFQNDIFSPYLKYMDVYKVKSKKVRFL